MTEQLIRIGATQGIAAVAKSTLSSKDEGVKAVAEAFGYSPEELSSIPAEANMGLLLWESDGDCFHSTRRGDRGSRLRRGPGCIPGVSTGGSKRPGHWYRHDSSNDRTCTSECAGGWLSECGVPTCHDRDSPCRRSVDWSSGIAFINFFATSRRFREFTEIRRRNQP